MPSNLAWELIESERADSNDGKNTSGSYTARVKVPNGWLVKIGNYSREQISTTAILANGPDFEFALGVTRAVSIAFVPDENHDWTL